MNPRTCPFARTILLALFLAPPFAPLALGQGDTNETPWVVYDGYDGPAKGRHIVLVSGDEEYRSEEALPQLGKILAKHHGFKCTVLFAIDPKTGEINPNLSNIPGLHQLQNADLMIIATRFRNLPDEQMKYIVDYIESGKPVIGLRTATHAFNNPKSKLYAKYCWNNGDKQYPGGFGKQVLGETWVSHHGNHGSQSTRGIIAKDADKHPILRGIKDGDIWGPTDVYGVRLPLSGVQPLVMGQVVAGMKATDKALEGPKNEPMMPIAWTRTYKTDSGKPARVFTTTMGASQDLESAGTRRLLVNASYWAIGLENDMPSQAKVDIVGDYQPTRFAFNGFKKGVRPSQLAIK